MHTPSHLVSARAPGSLVLVLALGSCGNHTPQPDAAPVEAAAPAAHGTAATARTAGTPLAFEPPADWKVQSPTSPMRKAQYLLPRAESDAKDAECVVYFFENGGGGVDANVERWCSQFEQPDGRQSKDVLTRSERTVAGMPVHEVQLSGTFVAETAPGSGVRLNEPGYRMIAAILDSDHGPYYVKLVGPAATVAKHEAAFRDFIGRVH